MTKLNDTQLMILSAASQRRDFSVYPLPKSVKATDTPKLLKKLISLQLIEETEAVGSATIWREHEDGYHVTLILADEGFKALGVEREIAKPTSKKVVTKKATRPTPAVRKVKQGDSKQDVIIALLRRTKGASIDELIEATGWQRHSVHGVMSGVLKKKLGLVINSEPGAHGRIYKIAGAV